MSWCRAAGRGKGMEMVVGEEAGRIGKGRRCQGRLLHRRGRRGTMEGVVAEYQRTLHIGRSFWQDRVAEQQI